MESCASIHDQQQNNTIIKYITKYYVYARVILLVLVLREMMQTLPAGRESIIIKVKIANCIFGDQVRKLNFQLFTCVYYFLFSSGLHLVEI